MSIIAILLAFSLLIGQMVRLPVGGPGIQVIDGASIVLLGQLLFLFLFRASKLGGARGAFSYSLLFFIGWCAVCIAFGVKNFAFGRIEFADLASGVLAAVRFIFPVVVVGSIMSGARRRIFTKNSFQIMYLAGVLVLTFGFFQGLFIENFALRYGPEYEWDYQGNRLVSVFLDPNLAASFSSGFFILSLTFLKSRLISERTASFGALLSFICTLMTLSRGGVIGLTVGYLAFWALNRRTVRVLTFRNASFVVVAFALGFWVIMSVFDVQFLVDSDRFGVSNESALIRFKNFASLLGIITDYPMFGVGFNYARAMYPDSFYGFSGSYVDGGIIVLLASLGFLGFLFFILATLGFKRSARLDGKIWLPFIIMFVIQSFATSTIFYPLIMCYFGAILSFGQLYKIATR